MGLETRIVKVFVSYSHRDASYLADDSLLGFLQGLNGEGVELWTDERIAAGAAWDQEIQQRLRSTDVALALVSQCFLDSAYCSRVEIAAFLERCRADGMVLLPIVLSPCEWERHPWLASRQVLPGGNETIEEHYLDPGRRKRLFLRIRQELRAAVDGVRRSREARPEPPPAPRPAMPGQAPLPGAAGHGVAERRRLTVLRCGLSPTELDGEPLDAGDLPEVLQDLMPEFHGLCAEVVERLGGHLARRLVNGALACFGYPEAHEDDCRRAVCAALEIRAGAGALSARCARDLRVRLRLRAGVHAGEVAGLAACADADERIAQSEAPAVAEYLYGVAAPDTVVVSGAAHRRVAGFFDTEALAPLRLPGGVGEEPVFQVIRDSGAASRFQVELRKGLTPLVGRRDEIALALGRWAEAKAGQGRLVMICAEAGTGKSRLLEEVRARICQEPCHWIECLCSPLHQGTALHPIVTVLAAWMRLDREAAIEDRLCQLETHLQELDVAREHLPLFAALLSIPCEGRYPAVELDPRERRRLTLELLVGATVQRSLDQPAVLVVEDLHWADPSTLEWLGLLLEQIPSYPILALLSSRPDFSPPAPWLQRSDASHLTLGRLDRGQVAEMIARIAGGKALPAEVEAEVVQKTEGLPLFVEDLTRMVLESGLVEEQAGALVLKGAFRPLAIPDNLQEVLAARLARLASARPVAQLGAAIGREFSFEMLREVAAMDDTALAAELDRLVAAGLLFRRGLLRRARYVWKHALVQEALLQSMAKRQRRQVHQRIAEVLEKCLPEIAEAQPELVALHLTEAGRTAEAVDYWLRAAQRAASAYAYAEAIQHARRGLDLLQELPESVERDRCELLLEATQGPGLIALKGWSAPEAGACLAKALQLCRRVGSSGDLPPIQYGLSIHLMMRARLQAVLELANELLATAGATRDDGVLLMARDALGAAHWWLGQPATACEHTGLGLAVYDPGRHHADLVRRCGQDPAAGCMMWRASSLWALGYPDQARAVAGEALRQAAAVEHRLSRALMTAVSAWTCLYLRDLRAEQHTEAVVSQAEGFPSFQALTRVVGGWTLAAQGRTEEGIAALRQGRDDWFALGGRTFFCLLPALLAEALMLAGRLDEAQSLVDRALADAPGQEDRCFWSELYRLKGDLLRLGGAPLAAAEEPLMSALEVARQQSARSLELRAAMSFARLRAEHGSREEARRLLGGVYGAFTEGFDTPDLVEASELLAELA